MSIKEFYSNRDILVTGGSGFIGKLIIEKLLYSCSDVGCIYMLLRSKRNKTVKERLKDLCEDAGFTRIRNEKPHLFEKLQIIEGDCLELGLGLSAENLKRLENVSVIIHSAASVRFNDPLLKAILSNMRGTLELLKIAETMKQLKVFIHVSTAFSNPDKLHVQEKLYPVSIDWRKAIKMAETFNAESMDILTPKYAALHPNTYTFTKNLTEHIINDYRHRVPVIIIRPSIVLCAINEPQMGYLDNFNGPVGITVLTAFGLISSCLVSQDCFTDIIPVDIVVRSSLMAAYKRAKLYKANEGADEVEIINCAAGKAGSIRNLDYYLTALEQAVRNPFKYAIWTPYTWLTSNLLLNWLMIITLDVPRAILIDLILKLLKKRPIAVGILRRFFTMSKLTWFFLSRTYHIENDKYLALQELLNDKEDLANFDISVMNSYDYKNMFRFGVCVVKEIMLKEQPYADNATKIRARIFKYLSNTLKITSSYLAINFLWRMLVAKLQISI